MPKLNITSWGDLGRVLCSLGMVDPVGTVEVKELGANLKRLIITLDLIPGSGARPGQVYGATDDDIPF